MVVSTMPNEGKSFVTLQMWKQMASAGIKSVFVDGDMRNSVIVNKYGIEKEDGSEMDGNGRRKRSLPFSFRPC